MSKQAAAKKEEPQAPEEQTPGAKYSIVAGRFGPAEEFNNRWRVNVPMSVSPEDTLDEHFWEHVSMNLRPGDEVHVLPDNQAWKQILHVNNAGRLFAHVIQLELYELTPTSTGQHLPQSYKIEFAGSHHKWRVVREGRPLKDGFETEALARRYAANHESAVQR